MWYHMQKSARSPFCGRCEIKRRAQVPIGRYPLMNPLFKRDATAGDGHFIIAYGSAQTWFAEILFQLPGLYQIYYLKNNHWPVIRHRLLAVIRSMAVSRPVQNEKSKRSLEAVNMLHPPGMLDETRHSRLSWYLCRTETGLTGHCSYGNRRQAGPWRSRPGPRCLSSGLAIPRTTIQIQSFEYMYNN